MDINTAKSILAQNKKTYNSIAQNFSQTRDRPWPEFNFFIKNYIKDGDNILDIGCGNGRLFDLLKDKNINYAGIDISEGLINEAKKQFINSQHNFLTDDLLNLNYQNKFDVIFCIAVLNHIPSTELRQQAIKNIYQALKPDGHLLMTNWNLWNIKSKKSWWRLKCKTPQPPLSRGQRNDPPPDKGGVKLDWNDIITHWGQDKLPLYYHAFTKNEIKKLLQKNNFKIIANYYNLENPPAGQASKKIDWRKGKNLITVAKKPDHA